MTNIQRKTMVMLFALLYTLLFFNQNMGLNLIVIELTAIYILRKDLKQNLSRRFNLLLYSLWSFTAITAFVVHSNFAIVIHLLMCIVLLGFIQHERMQNVIGAFAQGIVNIYHSPKAMLYDKTRSTKKRLRLSYFHIYFIPIVIIFIFIIIYSFANRIFGDILSEGAEKLLQNFFNLLEVLNGELIVTIIFGFVFGCVLLYKHLNQSIARLDEKNEDLARRRITISGRYFHVMGLHHEYLAGMFLLISLNAIIFLFNIVDITNIWFGFQWKGEDFASILHEGTALLIISVLASIAIVLYFFRNNLNFYNKHLLKKLALLWIAQNGILAISVLMRNYHYVNLFSLSHKRIGVFIFLIIVIIGLYTVWIKIQSKKTSWYLFKTNALQVVVILCICTAVHWDKLIARFNFSRGPSSFIYLSHMAQLDDAALPFLSKPLSELEQLSNAQYEQFNFREQGLTPEAYISIIEVRKNTFLNEYEKRDWRSWNVQDYITYKKLRSE